MASHFAFGRKASSPREEILFVGVEPLGRFDYETIRGFGYSALSMLGRSQSTVEHIAMTMHGTGFGLDESEAFRAELAGLLDAVHAGEQPSGSLRISIVDRDPEVVQRLRVLLDDVVPSGVIADSRSGSRGSSPTLGDARAQLGSVGHDSREKPHVFVAMPFAEEFTDRFHYGIKGAANAAGFLCERADLASFTGDVIAWVKDRIGSASLVVADLTTANPDVLPRSGLRVGPGRQHRPARRERRRAQVRCANTEMPRLQEHPPPGRTADRRAQDIEIRIVSEFSELIEVKGYLASGRQGPAKLVRRFWRRLAKLVRRF